MKKTVNTDAATADDKVLDPETQKMAADIDGAVAETIAKAKAEREAVATDGDPEKPSKQDLPPEGPRPGEETKTEDEHPKTDEDDGGITDAHVERAVKAGMTIADAKSFQSAEALDRVCGMLEDVVKLNTADDKGAKPGATEETGDEPDAEIEAALAAMPDLGPEEDNDEYDENIVKAFNAMKELLRGQAKTIKGLVASGEAGNWFDRQVDALGSAVKDAIAEAPEKRTALQGKFKVLEAGYKAANEKVEPATVFKEAVSLVLGDVVSQSDEQARAAALASRSRQHIQRPGGPTAKAKVDPMTKVADEIDRRIASTT